MQLLEILSIIKYKEKVRSTFFEGQEVDINLPTITIDRQDNDNFKQLFKQYPSTLTPLEGHLIEGNVISIKENILIINLGLKMTVYFPLEELPLKERNTIKVADTIQFIIEYLETHDGEIILDYDHAQKEVMFQNIGSLIKKNKDFINGIVLNHVEGGFSIGLGGLVAFLPRDQVLPLTNQTKKASTFVGSLKTFSILSINDSGSKQNIVVSRANAIKHMIRSKKAFY